MDYNSLENFRIRWQPDQVDPRYIPNPTNNDPVFEIMILDDNIPEPPGREYFEIDLTLNPTGNNRNGFFYPRAVGRVTIIDDDTRKFICCIVGKTACSPDSTIVFLLVVINNFSVLDGFAHFPAAPDLCKHGVLHASEYI